MNFRREWEPGPGLAHNLTLAVTLTLTLALATQQWPVSLWQVKG
jgi:hypothetical protein